MCKTSIIGAGIVLAIAGATAIWAPTLGVAADAPTVVRKLLMQQDLPITGYTLADVTVDIPVGGREGRHMHPGALMVYVMDGELTLDYEGKPTVTYKPGETFFVEAGKVHEGINKGTVPIKALASFVIEKGKALTTQVP